MQLTFVGKNAPANDEGGTPGTMSSRSPAPSNLSIEDMEERIHRIEDQMLIFKKAALAQRSALQEAQRTACDKEEAIIEAAEAAVKQAKETLQVKEYILESAQGKLDVLNAFYDKAIAQMESLWHERLRESKAEIRVIEAKINEARPQAVDDDASSTEDGA